MNRSAPLITATGLTALAGAASLRSLQWLGGQIDRPDDVSLPALEAWYQSVAPGGAGAAVTWAAATVLTIWVLVAAALQVVAAIAGGRWLRVAADAISPRSLQRFGHGLAGLSLSAGLAVAPSAGMPVLPGQQPTEPTEVIADELPDDLPRSTEAPSTGTATMTRIGEDLGAAPTTVSPTTTAAPMGIPSTTSTSAAPTTSASPDTGSATTTATAPVQAGGGDPSVAGTSPSIGTDLPLAPPAEPVVLSADPPPVAASGRSLGGAVGADVVVVEPGMSFWSIAEEVVAERVGSADGRAVSRYWHALISANRDRLVVPGNADLLFPGQELVLPAT